MSLRPISPRLISALQSAPVVLLVGPRRSGQTTTLQELVRTGHASRYLTLEDRQTQRKALVDPRALFEENPSAPKRLPTAIDEAHLVPELFPFLVERVARGDRFILSGSTELANVADLQALDSKQQTVHLWPLSHEEVEGHGPTERFVERLFDKRDDLLEPRPRMHDADWLDVLGHIPRSSFPEAVSLEDPDVRNEWHLGYLGRITEGELSGLRRFMGPHLAARVFDRLAQEAPGLLAVTTFARDLGTPPTTLKRDVHLFEQAGLVRLIPGFRGGDSSRRVTAPRILFTDTGLLCQRRELIEVEPFAEDTPGLVTAYIGAELFKQAQRLARPPSLSHYLTYQGTKVDWVLENADGSVAGVDVVLGVRPGDKELIGLRRLREVAGAKFRKGVLLHTGNKAEKLEKDLVALPLSAVWTR